MKNIISFFLAFGVIFMTNSQETVEGIYFSNEHPSYNSEGIHSSHISQWNRLSLGLKSENNSFRIEDWRLGGTNLKTLLSVNLNGNIGIGITNPSEKLHIYKINSGVSFETKFTGNAIEFNRSNNSTSFIDKKDNGSLSFRMGSNYLTRMSILNNGNIGIGTSNPDMKLTVKGSIHAEEVKIDLSVPAPDYVFKEDYQLRSIEEIESFVKEHNHLPEIPSAKEFEQNGILQGEMDMNLLKKIEELTLYTIQQHKEIESLKKENDILRTLNAKVLELQKRLEKLEKK